MIKSFVFPPQPLSKKVILAYFDLRKFSQIENSMDAKGIYQILNKMHELISERVEELGGTCVRFIGDNCLVVFDAANFDTIFSGIGKIKKEVDQLFSELGKTSVIHVLLHCADGNIGMLGGKRNKRLDVSGKVLNELGYYMMKIDTSGNPTLFNSYCLSSDYFKQLNEKQNLVEVQAQDCFFYMVK